MSFDIIGSAVLVDSNGNPYSAGTASNKSTPANFLGAIVLIDPETGEPYKIGE